MMKSRKKTKICTHAVVFNLLVLYVYLTALSVLYLSCLTLQVLLLKIYICNKKIRYK